MLDPSCERFLRILSAGGGAAHPRDAAARRESFRTLLSLAGSADAAPAITIDRVVASPHGAIPVRLYRPEGIAARADPLPTCVFFHGGGFVAGSIETRPR